MNTKLFNKKYRFLSFIPAICIMILIFYFSSQDATHSSSLSGGFVDRIYDLIKSLFGLKLSVPDRIAFLEIAETIIRKIAHMTEYALLAISIAFAFFVYGKRGWKLVLWAESLCVLYAMSDELHQLFIPGRSCQALDVFIDGCGAIIGCLIFHSIITKKH